MKKLYILSLIALLLSTAIPLNASDNPTPGTDGWMSLFNGENLDGWTPKMAKHPLGYNYKNTFIVEDGILKANYDEYDSFDMQFGHLYTNNVYSHYRIRLDYLFTGKGLPDAPHWTALNSGIMIHCQSPLSVRLTQGFPVSIEGQFLAEGATAGTQTANIVTPGTHVTSNNKFTKEHIIDSSSQLFPLDTWVTFEAEVRGNESIVYFVNGEEVHRCENPVLDAEDQDGKALLEAGANIKLSFGHIALQAEGQPVWFRNIEIKPL